jgi:valyl-tRNA synthetase
LVMCATFGDTTDLEWYQTYQLPYKKVINQDGRICEDVPFIGDLKVKEAREVILRKLEENGLLIKRERLDHTVSVHERCGTEVEIISSKQWFIDVMKDKDKFLEAANKINWYPQYMKARYETWVKNLKWDWCISRQRNFGIPLPVWYCQDCGETIFAKEENLPVNPLETSPRERCLCGSINFIPEYAVLDTWATSSLTPLINSKWGEENSILEKILPMSMRTQAHEIIRTWAFYTIVKSIYHTGQIPWKDIMICGFVLAKKGEKISKSKDNATLSPNALIEKYSADAIRYWAANAKLGTDTMFAEDELQTAKRFITKLWNAAKFVLMHLEDYEMQEIEYTKLMPIDRWILEKHSEMQDKVIKYMNEYEVGSARHEIDEYFWKDFCDNYLEIVKDRVYKPEVHGSKNRLSAQYALYHSFLGILKIYAVYVPHIVEEIYQAFFKRFEKSASIHSTTWSTRMVSITGNLNNTGNIGDTGITGKKLDKIILKYGEIMKEILVKIRKYKSDKNLSLKTELESILITTSDENILFLKMTVKDLHACTGAKSIKFIEDEKFNVAITA